MSKEYSHLGITSVETSIGNTVQVYDIERTLCDFIINREKNDSELFVKTLQLYADYPMKNTEKLYEYATEMHIIEETKRTLELLI